MIYLVIALIVFAALLLAVLIETKASIHLTWIIPLSLGIFTGTYVWAKSMFGYPTDLLEEGKQFIMLNYYVPPSEDKIYVWAIVEEESVPKAFEMPYERLEHERLQRVGQKMEEGAKFIGAFRDPSPTGAEGKGEDQDGNGRGNKISMGGQMAFRELSPEAFLPSKDDFYGED